MHGAGRIDGRMHSWDDHYRSADPLPWDTGVPDAELVAAFSSGALRPGRALEIGCGTGTNAVWLARQGCRVTAVDVSPLAIERARKRVAEAGVDVDLHVADVLAEPLPGGPYDLVFDRGCFHVFDGAGERATFARRVARALAPGGVWLSLVGSTEGAPREMGPPRRSARDLARAIEPHLAILDLRASAFRTGDEQAPAAWICLSGKRREKAQPSTRWRAA
jgi:SAM-dependent methyltransferase